MKHGIIHQQPTSLEPAVSFKIAGDSLIEQEKLKTKEEYTETAMPFSEFSSIISMAKEDPFKKD